jgi:hypothetical protein
LKKKGHKRRIPYVNRLEELLFDSKKFSSLPRIPSHGVLRSVIGEELCWYLLSCLEGTWQAFHWRKG